MPPFRRHALLCRGHTLWARFQARHVHITAGEKNKKHRVEQGNNDRIRGKLGQKPTGTGGTVNARPKQKMGRRIPHRAAHTPGSKEEVTVPNPEGMPRGTQLSTQREELKEEKTSHQERIAFVTHFPDGPSLQQTCWHRQCNRLHTCVRTLTRFENILPLSRLLHSSDTTKRRFATQDQLAERATNGLSQADTSPQMYRDKPETKHPTTAQHRADQSQAGSEATIQDNTSTCAELVIAVRPPPFWRLRNRMMPHTQSEHHDPFPCTSQQILHTIRRHPVGCSNEPSLRQAKRRKNTLERRGTLGERGHTRHRQI